MRPKISAVPALFAIALAALVLPPAASVASAEQIAEVRIYAKDIDTGADYAWVEPGGTLVLPPRVEVRLRIEAIPPNRGPRYPSGRFEDATHRGLTGRAGDEHRFAGILDTNPEMGSAVLQTYGREGESEVRYTILDNSLTMPSNLRSATFTVRVDHEAELVAVTPPETAPPIVTDPGSVGDQAARELVTAYYRGILMREPEPRALDDWSDRIEDRGYPEAIAVAADIARSEESRLRIYQGGTSYEARLAALYEHLLGMEARSVDPDQWRDDLERLRDGQVDQVVGEMVRSAEFRDRFGFPDFRFAHGRDSL